MGFWGKAMTIIGFIALALIVSLFGLSFLSSFANKDSQAETDVYPDLGNEFEDDIPTNSIEEGNDGEDYGEKEALRQQESLLKEMMSQSAPPKYFEQQEQSNIYDKGSMRQSSPLSLSGNVGNSNNEEIRFESLLNNFESVANRKPDLLAKKIEVWLDEKE
jgi:hypothetical protein